MKKQSIREPIVFLVIAGGIFGFLAYRMGLAHVSASIMKTAHDLLLNTVFFIMAICVLTGALGKLMIEFGVIGMLERILAPLMKPIYNLPGAAALGGIVCFFSDNPAIVALARDREFARYFKDYQLASLVNFGTCFGMGMIVVTFMVGQGFGTAAVVGFFGAVVGGIISTRIMQALSRHHMPARKPAAGPADPMAGHPGALDLAARHDEGGFLRFLNSLLDGGKTGVDLGLAIIPGVLCITTFVMMFVFGPKDPAVGYQGLAYEGVPLLTQVGGYLSWIFDTLFGFKAPELIAFPMTSLGAVGAAIGLVPRFVSSGLVTPNDIAVFTAIGMCWSGYLSTHTAMLDALNFRPLISRAIAAHTIGGIAGGVFAHFSYVGLAWWFGW